MKKVSAWLVKVKTTNARNNTFTDNRPSYDRKYYDCEDGHFIYIGDASVLHGWLDDKILKVEALPPAYGDTLISGGDDD